MLDRAEALRARRRAALALLDELTQSIFLDMFGDPVKQKNEFEKTTLGHIVEEFRYGTSNKSGADGFPALRIPNVVGGKIDTVNLRQSVSIKMSLNDFAFLDGDLLFVRTNGNPDYVGRCAVFTPASVEDSAFDADSFIYASYLIRARLKDEVNPVFMRELMQSAQGRRQIPPSMQDVRWAVQH